MTEAQPTDRSPVLAFEHARPRRVLLRDVARAAGVSHQTVSRVLNNHPHVASSTRERVVAAIGELDYRPHPAARALANGETRTLGVITFDPAAFGPASTMQGINQAAAEAGWSINVAELPSWDRDVVKGTIERVSTQAIDGIICIAPYRMVAAALEGVARHVPMTTVDASKDELSVDEFGGAREATEHLLSLGHRTVFHVSGRVEWTAAAERTLGWQAALEAAGVPVPDPVEGDWTAASGYEHARLLAQRPDVTAIFAANDQMALGALRALHDAGRRVPEDVSVVGYDDIPEAAFLNPALTTMHIDFSAIGRRCLAIMFDRLSGDAAPSRPPVRPSFVLRESSGPAPR